MKTKVGLVATAALAIAVTAILASIGAVLVARSVGIAADDLVPIAGIVAALTATVTSAALSAWSSTAERAHARQLARDARLYERRAVAYVEIIESQNRITDKMATTLPFMGQHVDPFEMTDEQREALSNEARHVDALVVVSGSKALRRLLREIRAIDTKFWLNASRYLREGGAGGPERFERYREAHDLRTARDVLLKRVRDQVGVELEAIAAAEIGTEDSAQ